MVNNFAAFWARRAAMIDGLKADDCRPLVSLGMMNMLSGKDVHGNSLVALYMGGFDATKFSAADQIRL